MPKFEDQGTIHVNAPGTPKLYDEHAFDRDMAIPEEVVADAISAYQPIFLTNGQDHNRCNTISRLAGEIQASERMPLGEAPTNGNVCLHIQSQSPRISLDDAVSSDVMKALEVIYLEISANLKFTKAIYRGTKKGLSRPGYEPALLQSTRSFSSDDTSSNLKRFPKQGYQGSQHQHPNLLHNSSATRSFISEAPSSNSERSPKLWHGSRRIRDPLVLRQNSSASGGIGFSSEGASMKERQISGEVKMSAQADKDAIGSGAHEVHESLQATANDEELQPCHPNPTLQSQIEELPRSSTTGTTLSQIAQEHVLLQNRATVKMWRFMEDPRSSRGAHIFFYWRIVLLALSVIVACVEAFDDSFSSRSVDSMTFIQLGTELGFTIELLLRLGISSDRVAFIFNGFNAIDFLSALPGALRIYCLVSGESTIAIVALLGLAPVVRLLKMLRYFDTFQLLWSAFSSAAEALPVLIFTLFVIASTFGSLIYLFEPRSSIPSMPLALYFSIVTVSTVGYGDFVPVSGPGRIATCLLSVIGPMYMAIPIGIIGTAFSQVWEDRHRLMMLHKIRQHVNNVGYTQNQLWRMFDLLDTNGDGQLEMEEFLTWLDVIRINMPGHIASQVFESFDADSEGTIDFQELLGGLYPRARYGLNHLRKTLLSLRTFDSS